MKKILLFYFVFSALTQTSKATEISNPFYLPTKDTVNLSTTISYKKFHVQKLINGYQDYRTRNRFVEESFMYGVAPKVSILASFSNRWERKKFDNLGLTDKSLISKANSSKIIFLILLPSKITISHPLTISYFPLLVSYKQLFLPMS